MRGLPSWSQMKQLNNILSPMKSRFIFMIGDEGAILIYMENGSVVRRLFAASSDQENTYSFIELLKAHPKTPIYVLVDMMDQSYVRHALPPVTPLGLGKLVQRRLDRDFSKEDIKGALNLGRETEGRKDWNFLLISLSHSDILKSWLNLVYELPNSLAGIYLVPVECEVFISDLDAILATQNKRIIEDAPPPQSLSEIKEKVKLEADAAGVKAGKKPFNIEFKLHKKSSPKGEQPQGSKSQWQILVCHNKVGGFRQVVLKNGKLIFTRLTQAMNDSQPEVLAGNVEQEVLNTIEYLKRLSYNPKAGLDIYIIVAQEIKSSISTLRFGATNTHVLTPFETAELLKLKQAVLSGDRFADVVIASAFGVSKKVRLRMHSNYSARLGTLEKAHKGLRAAAAACILGLLGYNAYTFISMQSISSGNNDLRTEKQTKESTLSQLNEASLQLPADVDEVVDMMFFFDLLNTKYYNLLDLVRDISGVIDDSSLVTSMSWNANNIINPTEDKTKNQQIQVSIDFEIVYTEENWEAFQAKYDAFVKKFKDMLPDYDVTSSQLPGTFNTEDSLKVNFEDLETQRAGPPPGEVFTVTIGISGPIDRSQQPPPEGMPVGGIEAPGASSGQLAMVGE